MRTFEVGGTAFIAGGVVAAVLALLPSDQFRDCRTERVAGLDEIGGHFALVTEAGNLITNSKLFERPILLNFGYSFCPDDCRTDTARNAEAVSMLAEKGFEILPVFITVDPARDTAERLREYTDGFHVDMLGLTGRPDQIASVAEAYRVTYAIHEQGDQDLYSVDHSANSYLALPDHGIVDVVRSEIDASSAAEKIACYMAKA